VYPYYNLALNGPPIVAPAALVGQRQGEIHSELHVCMHIEYYINNPGYN
jgi:hypothetical protein